MGINLGLLMLAVSPLITSNISRDEEGEGEMERFSMECHDFGDLSDGNLLESINFDDIFVGIDDGDVLPDLEMDPEIFADFSLSTGDDSDMATSSSVSLENVETDNKVEHDFTRTREKEKEDKVSSDSGEEIVSQREESVSVVVKGSHQKEGDKGTKKSSSSSADSKNSQAKRKVKVITLFK